MWLGKTENKTPISGIAPKPGYRRKQPALRTLLRLRRHTRHRPAPRLPLASLLLLALALKIVSLYHSSTQDSHLLLNDFTPVTVYMRDTVAHHNILGLCTNNKVPGSHRSSACKYLISPSSPHKLINLWALLIMCGDIETNPGPVAYDHIFPCGWCDLKVDWGDNGVACDQCDVWYHTDCIGMTTPEYVDVANTSWKCYKCNTTNCSSFLYNGYNVNVSNSFQVLAGIPGDDSVFENLLNSPDPTFTPTAHSSPSGTQFIPSTAKTPSNPTYSSIDSSMHQSTKELSTLANPEANLRHIVVNVNSASGKNWATYSSIQQQMLCLCAKRS